MTGGQRWGMVGRPCPSAASLRSLTLPARRVVRHFLKAGKAEKAEKPEPAEPAAEASAPAKAARKDRQKTSGGEAQPAPADDAQPAADASSPTEPWTLQRCCSAAKVDALEQALTGVDAWITGIRREQTDSRAAAEKLERDERRGIWKVNPLADWTDKDVWTYIFKHDLPYNPLHDQGYASIGCQPCTRPGDGREGRWAGLDKTECGIHQ